MRVLAGLITAAVLAVAVTPAVARPHAQPNSPEAAADELKLALESSDFGRIQTLISPAGFEWAMSGGHGVPTKTPQQATDFLRAESGGRLQIAVQARPVGSSAVPWGTRAVASVWTNFGNVPQQQVQLVLVSSGGSWYWAGGFITSAPVLPFRAPPTSARLPATATERRAPDPPLLPD